MLQFGRKNVYLIWSLAGRSKVKAEGLSTLSRVSGLGIRATLRFRLQFLSEVPGIRGLGLRVLGLRVTVPLK